MFKWLYDIRAKQGIRSFIRTSYWIAAFSVGLVSVAFAEIFTSAQELYLQWFHLHPYWLALGTPAIFVLATAIVVYLAPSAAGSGIPQVLYTLDLSRKSHTDAVQSDYVSLRTGAVKILSATVGLLGGASIGREGPTIQISTSLFTWVGKKTKEVISRADFHSFTVAGAAAGLSAAFNTPIAGITFVIEELADGTFGTVRQSVMMSVIIAGITAQAILGNYLYFGYPRINETGLQALDDALLVGLVGGLFGGLFARMLAYSWLDRLRLNWWKKALLCGALVSVIALLTQGDTVGTGYEITRGFMNDPEKSLPIVFPIAKLLATYLSYVSGMAGGIFSPSLSIGAGIGSTVGQLADLTDLRMCGLLGMVGFFTGVIQAPITAVIIVMEMTDQHSMIIPLMVAAFVASGVGRFLMPRSLYHYLAQKRFDATQQERLLRALPAQLAATIASKRPAEPNSRPKAPESKSKPPTPDGARNP